MHRPLPGQAGVHAADDAGAPVLVGTGGGLLHHDVAGIRRGGITRACGGCRGGRPRGTLARAEPLLLEGVQGAVRARLRQRLVERGREPGVVLAHHDAVLLPRGDLQRDLELGVGVEHLVLHDGQVGHRRLIEPALHAREGGDGIVQRHDVRTGQVLARPGLPGRARLDGHGHASLVERGGVVRLDGTREGGGGDDPLVGVDVGVGEVDLFQALVGDGEVGRAHVGPAALLDHGDDRVELLGGQELALEPELLGERLHELHLEARWVGGPLLYVVEGGVGEVRDHAQLARAHQAQVFRRVAGGGGRARAARESQATGQEHREDKRHPQALEPRRAPAVPHDHHSL